MLDATSFMQYSNQSSIESSDKERMYLNSNVDAPMVCDSKVCGGGDKAVLQPAIKLDDIIEMCH